MLEPMVTGEYSFIELAKSAMQKDNRRSRKNKNFSEMTIQEKFSQMFDVIDNEYIKEYNRFVKNVSYAPQELIPDFFTAIAAVRRLVNHVLTREFMRNELEYAEQF